MKLIVTRNHTTIGLDKEPYTKEVLAGTTNCEIWGLIPDRVDAVVRYIEAHTEFVAHWCVTDDIPFGGEYANGFDLDFESVEEFRLAYATAKKALRVQ